MKKSALLLLLSAAFCCAACDDDSKSNDKTDNETSNCSETCSENTICAKVDGKYKCAEKCDKEGIKKTCKEADGMATVSADYICAMDDDNKNLVKHDPQPGVADCTSNACNADKTDCAEPTEVVNKCSEDCTNNTICAKVDGKYKCAEKCDKEGVKKTCKEADGMATVSADYICAMDDDNKNLVKHDPQPGVADCTSNACNADKTDCAAEEDLKASLCTASDGLSICETGFDCVLVDYYGETTPLCVDLADKSCTQAEQNIISCNTVDDKAILTTKECYAGVNVDAGNIFALVTDDPCENDEVCGTKDGQAACIKSSSTGGGTDLGCGADFKASCNSDGSTTACINGKVTNTPWSSSTTGTCHVFADAQYAGYIIEESCTVLEMPIESCLSSIYVKKTCGKAENGKYYWYMSAANYCECNSDGKTCK